MARSRLYVFIVQHCLVHLSVPVKVVSDHMFGEGHTKSHRLIVSATVTLVGSSLTHLTDLSTNALIHTVGAGIGELLGALGMSPVLEHVVHMGTNAQRR